MSIQPSTLKIAIIGGGAAGLITAYLLDKAHRVTLFEKEAVLGGNVRTLNGNVQGTDLPPHLEVENGVLGFSQPYYPNFHKLMRQMDVDLLSYRPSASLFSDGYFFPGRTSALIHPQVLKSAWQKPGYIARLRALDRAHRAFRKELTTAGASQGAPFQDFHMPELTHRHFTQALFMLSFSTPFDQVTDLPASIWKPYFQSLPGPDWSFVKGGVYAYMERIIRSLRGNIHLNAQNIRLKRNADGIDLWAEGEGSMHFDKVVIATTPGAVMNILTDPTDAEGNIFSTWNDRIFTTLAHTDTSFYAPFRTVRKTPMDLFARFRGDAIGYNTYMNGVYGLDEPLPYSFAYGLEDVIDPARILHRADHTVPVYDQKHDERIERLRTINGHNHTYYAGAWLGNGLHEGAVTSASWVSEKLGGMILDR